MDLNRKNTKRIKSLIIFTAVVVLALMKFDWLCQALLFVINIIKPFLMGAVMAFVINLPMSFIENRLFEKRMLNGRKQALYMKIKRPVSLILALLIVLLVITLVIVTVIPQLVSTFKVLANEIPVFMQNMLGYLEKLFAENPELQKEIESVKIPEINWKEILQTVVDFLKNGMGSMVTTTVTVASSIVSGTVNFFISLIFSFYILAQKEKLGNQIQRTIRAYTKPGVYEWIMKVAGLLNQNFSRFITGQCMEAVILGAMFVVSMLILRFPFAVMIGVLIAFTALIPIVGAFIGCVIGAFLIMVDSPAKAIGFIILFLILQQIEGNLIYPHVVGNSVGLPSIWVLAAVTIGGSLMGIAGMLIFIPLLSTVYALLREDVNKRNGKSSCCKSG
ncbi:MAG: AI-2E family transporter [Lachnospiraceae bacterium]|nr:AI-2E family transporter [Lachnospiraceae bacterium]